MKTRRGHAENLDLRSLFLLFVFLLLFLERLRRLGCVLLCLSEARDGKRKKQTKKASEVDSEKDNLSSRRDAEASCHNREKRKQREEERQEEKVLI